LLLKNKERKMAEEKKSKAKEFIDMMIITGFVCVFTVHLNSVFKTKNKSESGKLLNAEQTVNKDSVRTDSVPTASFVRCQMQQQRTK
jgi:hypothetical protein